MLKIEFDDWNLPLAGALGLALATYANQGLQAERTGDDPAPKQPVPGPEVEKIVNKPVEQPDPVPESAVRVDSNGVPYDAEFCVGVNAAKPFKQDGTWKKKRGTSDADYAEWYAAAKPAGPEPEPAAPINTAEAFGTEPAPTAVKVPTDPSAFMLWISEQMAAGNLTQADIDAAYVSTGIGVTDLFNGTVDELTSRVSSLYTALNPQ